MSQRRGRSLVVFWRVPFMCFGWCPMKNYRFGTIITSPDLTRPIVPKWDQSLITRVKTRFTVATG
jgi:hypothetical protein